MVLQVDALGGRVGREQDAHVRLVRAGLEGGLDPLAILRLHPAVHGQQAVGAPEPLGREQLHQPLLGVAVLGEDDDALLGPGSARHDRPLQPADQLRRLAVRPRRGRRGPGAQLAEVALFLVRQLLEEVGRRRERLGGALAVGIVVAELLLDPLGLAAQHRQRRR